MYKTVARFAYLQLKVKNRCTIPFNLYHTSGGTMTARPVPADVAGWNSPSCVAEASKDSAMCACTP